MLVFKTLEEAGEPTKKTWDRTRNLLAVATGTTALHLSIQFHANTLHQILRTGSLFKSVFLFVFFFFFFLYRLLFQPLLLLETGKWWPGAGKHRAFVCGNRPQVQLTPDL